MATDSSEKVAAELKRISILLALNMMRGQTQRQQIEFLASVGFEAREIANIVQTTPNTVHVTLSRQRAGKRLTSARDEPLKEASE